jgi:hypothetical protein
MQERTIVQCPLEVAHDALHGHQMRLSRILHMQTDLLHGIGGVGSCEGQVMESSYNAPTLGSILNRRPRVYSKLHLEVDQSHAWLTISHGHTHDDVQCASALVEEHPVWTVPNNNADEVVKRPEVLYREFPL